MALTHARASGSFTGRRYGSFEGRVVERPRLTQARAFGVHTGMRYGPFSGRVAIEPPPVVQLPSGGRVYFPTTMIGLQRRKRITEDELLLLLASCCDGNSFLH